jgi:hypothetical protein
LERRSLPVACRQAVAAAMAPLAVDRAAAGLPAAALRTVRAKPAAAASLQPAPARAAASRVCRLGAPNAPLRRFVAACSPRCHRLRSRRTRRLSARSLCAASDASTVALLPAGDASALRALRGALAVARAAADGVEVASRQADVYESPPELLKEGVRRHTARARTPTRALRRSPRSASHARSPAAAQPGRMRPTRVSVLTRAAAPSDLRLRG